MVNRLVLLSGLSWASNLVAAPDTPVRLVDLLREARARNPRLLAARSRRDARRQRRAQVASLPDPTLGLSVQLRSVETRVGPQRAALGVSQRFPLGGKRRLRGEVADHAAEVERQRVAAVRYEIEARLKRAFYSYWFTRRARAVTREVLALVTSSEEVARTRYASGRGPQEVVLKAQVEIGVLEDRLRSLGERVPVFADEIAALLDRPPGADLGPPAPGDVAEREVTAPLDDLYRLAAVRSPAVRGLATAADGKRVEARLARRARVPDLTAGLSWIFTGEARAPFTPRSGDDPVVASVSINLPVRRRRYAAAARERDLERDALARDLRGKTNDLEAELRRWYFGYQDARRKMSLYRDSLVPKGRQALEATFAAYQGDRASFLDLLDAERTLLGFELSLARGVADHLTAIAEIERLVAGPVSRAVAR